MGVAAGIGVTVGAAGLLLVLAAISHRQPAWRDCGLAGAVAGVVIVATAAPASPRAWVLLAAPLLALVCDGSRLLLDHHHGGAIHVEQAAWRAALLAMVPPVVMAAAASLVIVLAIPAGTVPSGLLPAAMWVPAAALASLAAAAHRLGRRRGVLRRPRRALPVAVVVLVAAGALAALGAEARSVQGIGETRAPASATVAPDIVPVGDDRAEAEEPAGADRGAPPVLRWVLALLGLAAVVAAIVVLGQREQLVPPEDLVPDPVVREPLVSSGRAPVGTETVDRAATLDVVDDALVQLRADTEPRVAVRIAYATVTHGLGRRSFARRAAETEGEYLARLLDDLGAGSADLTELTELFTHARFSDEPIDEEMRRAAIAALSRLRSVLHADGAAPAGRHPDHGHGA